MCQRSLRLTRTMKWCLAITLICGLALQAYADDDLDIDLPTVDQNLPTIPGLDKLPLPFKFNVTQFAEAHERAEEVLREKCTKNGGELAYETQTKGKDDLIDCVKNLFNVTHILQEVEKHKPLGDLELVFRKECGKRDILMECISNFTESMDGCLDEREKENKALLNNITTQLFSFVCHKEGDRIALFIAEKGPECLQDKQSAMLQCINNTYSKHFPDGVPEFSSLPSLVISADQCSDVDIVQCCIVNELESCQESTPANVVESVMKYVRRVTPCNSTVSCPLGSSASAPSFAISLAILSASILRWFWG